MIVEAKVIRSFKHVETGRIWFEGETFTGSSEDAAELARKGYVEHAGDTAPKASPSFAALTMSELRGICAERGIDTPPRARKADLIAAIEARG